MTLAEPSFITKYCQHHYFDNPMNQKHGGPGNWPPNTEHVWVGLFWFALYPKAHPLFLPKQDKDCYRSLRILQGAHDHLFSKNILLS